MENKEQNITSIKFLEKLKQLCEDCGFIHSEARQPFYGEIVLVIQKGKLIYTRRSETMK